MNVQIVAPSDRIIISGQAGVPSASGSARTSEACVRRGAAYEALAVAIAAIATVRDRSAARFTVGMQCNAHANMHRNESKASQLYSIVSHSLPTH